MAPRWGLVGLPCLAVIAYDALYRWSPAAFARWAQGELGVVELSTAGLFAAAAVGAFGLATRGRTIPSGCRALFAAFGVLTLLVALEEINYGQHFVGWHSSPFFAQWNRQGETNLHNLFGSYPGKRLSVLADIGSTFVFVLLPLAVAIGARLGAFGARVSGGDHTYAPGSWFYYLLPHLELAPLTLLTRVLIELRGVPGMAPDRNELRELLWAWAAFGYILLLRRRLLPSGSSLAAELVPDAGAADLVSSRVVR